MCPLICSGASAAQKEAALKSLSPRGTAEMHAGSMHAKGIASVAVVRKPGKHTAVHHDRVPCTIFHCTSNPYIALQRSSAHDVQDNVPFRAVCTPENHVIFELTLCSSRLPVALVMKSLVNVARSALSTKRLLPVRLPLATGGGAAGASAPA